MKAAVRNNEQPQLGENSRQEIESPQRVLRVLTAGGLAGAVSRTATAPIDRLKMLLMVDNGAEPKSLQWGIRKIISEGPVSWAGTGNMGVELGSTKAYFKGNGTNVLKIAPETAIKLSMNDVLKQHIAQDPEDVLPLERFVCGGLAGGVAQLTIFPMEVIRTRLATSPHGTYRGLVHAALRIYQTEGCFAFYRGLIPNMAGIFPYAGVEIACFGILFEHLSHHDETMPPAHLIVAAGTCSATLAQFIAYPFSLVKTRLQAQGVDGERRRYRGMTDCFRTILRDEGYRGLYKGLLPNFIKLAPAAGLSWLVFEWTKQILGLNGHSAPS